MQLPPLDRTVSWPPAGADLASAGANAAPPPRASRPETTAIQSAVSQPEPSVKIEISSAFDEIVKQEKAAQAKAAANPLTEAGPVIAGKKPVETDEVSKLSAEAAAKLAEKPTEVARKVDTGKLPGPEQPSTDADAPSKDWTTKAKAAEEKPAEPPKEPISKKLLDFLQTLWRAGGQAIDVTDDANKTLNPAKASDGPLTYSDPSVKKTTGV